MSEDLTTPEKKVRSTFPPLQLDVRMLILILASHLRPEDPPLSVSSGESAINIHARSGLPRLTIMGISELNEWLCRWFNLILTGGKALRLVSQVGTLLQDITV